MIIHKIKQTRNSVCDRKECQNRTRINIGQENYVGN